MLNFFKFGFKYKQDDTRYRVCVGKDKWASTYIDKSRSIKR